MFTFFNSVKAWKTGQFETVLKQELDALDPGDFNLEKDMSYTGFFVENSLEFSVISSKSCHNSIDVTLGIYFQEYMTTCPCSGDETEIFNGYCEKQIIIDVNDASVQILSG